MNLVNLEAEQAVLGGVMLNSAAYLDVAYLAETDYSMDAHGLIWRAIQRLSDERKPFDPLVIADVLQHRGELEMVGGVAYLCELAHNTASAANIRAYAAIVRERSQLRALVRQAHEVIRIATDDSESTAAERIAAVQSAVMSLTQQESAAEEAVDLKAALRGFLAELERRNEAQGIPGLSTSFPELDRLTGGLKPGELWIVAARPAMGKTAISINIAERLALQGRRALVVSLEMSEQQLLMRMAASVGHVSLNAMGQGSMNALEWDGVSAAVHRLATTNITLSERANTVARIATLARRLQYRQGLDLIVVDYIGLMEGGRKENRVQEVSEITRGLKLLAKDLHVPIIALSQLNRGVEGRADQRPLMSDLRESGSIEQDADVILMMYRDEYYNPNQADSRGIAECLVRKNRMGETGTVLMTFMGQFSSFLPLAGGLPTNYGKKVKAGATESKEFY